MRLLYDLTATQPATGKYHGGGEYGKVVFERLLEIAEGTEVIGLWDPDRWIDPNVRASIQAHDILLREVGDYHSLQNALEGGDRFYSALPYNYGSLDFSGVEFIATVHGLRPVEMPTDRYEYRYDRTLRGWAKYVGKHILRDWYINRHRRRFQALIQTEARAKTVIVPSRHTKYAFLDVFPAAEEVDVRVLYSPQQAAATVAGTEPLEEAGVVPEQYVLLVSGGRWIKNAYRAVRALDVLFDRHPSLDLQVVVAGVEDAMSLFGVLRNRSRFHFFGYVKRPVLESLYQHAHSLLYPTLNEGFGYPPLEAMRYGTPVICSGVTSLPEVCQDAALYVSPYSAGEIRNRVLTLAREEAVYREYQKRAERRYEQVAERQSADLDALCHLLLHPHS